MQYIHISHYAQTGNIEILDKPVPTPQPDEVLIKVKAVTVNDYEWTMVTGEPKLYRLMHGIFKPKNGLPGMEYAGVVESVGSQIKNFKPGDKVFGDTSDYFFGTFAEYICLREQAIFKMPSNATFAEATSLPHASMLAYQGLIKEGNIKEGQKILINGAGGGVGIFGVQIAKMYGAEVTGVDTAAKLDTMKNWGYDHVIDYKKIDFTKTGEQYDLILDARSTRNPSDYERALLPGGVFVTVGGDLPKLIKIMFVNKFLGKKNLRMLALRPNQGLYQIVSWFEQGKLKTHIDGPYPMEKSADAILSFGKATHKGKVVITIDE